MDLQSHVKAYLQTLTDEQRAAFMVNLQLSYASRTAQQASQSSESVHRLHAGPRDYYALLFDVWNDANAVPDTVAGHPGCLSPCPCHSAVFRSVPMLAFDMLHSGLTPTMQQLMGWEIESPILPLDGG